MTIQLIIIIIMGIILIVGFGSIMFMELGWWPGLRDKHPKKDAKSPMSDS